jgi:hypothetical protein
MENINERIHKAIYSRLAANWNEAADGAIAWPNADFDPDARSAPWLRVAIQAVAARQYTISGLGAPSGQLFRYLLIFQIFTPTKTGTLAADQIADKLAALFNQVRVSVEGAGDATLDFFEPSPAHHVGQPALQVTQLTPALGRWHQVNLTVPCEFLAP